MYLYQASTVRNGPRVHSMRFVGAAREPGAEKFERKVNVTGAVKIDKISYRVNGGTVVLAWAGGDNIAVLSGDGEFDFTRFGGLLSDESIHLTTKGFVAGSGYTVDIDLSKGSGAIVEPVLEAPRFTYPIGGTWSNLEDPASSAFFAALSTPPTAERRALYNSLIVGLKADGLWTPLDWLLILAAEDSQAARVNLKTPAKVATAVNSPTFTADRGYAGDGATSYIDLGEVYNVAGNSFALDSATIGVWNNTSVSVGQKGQIGNLSGATRSFIASHSAGNEIYRINDSTDSTLRVGSTHLGHRAASRESSALKRGYFNGALVSDLTTASTAINAASGTILTSTTVFSADRVAAAYSGSAMTAAQLAAMHTRLSTFLTAIGAN
jgi:hypothetical protein